MEQVEPAHVAALKAAASQKVQAGEARLIRLEEVRRRTGLGTSAIYGRMAKSEFPVPVLIGRRHVAWHLSQVQSWIDSRPPARFKVAA